jgi:hypothetical protein
LSLEIFFPSPASWSLIFDLNSTRPFSCSRIIEIRIVSRGKGMVTLILPFLFISFGSKYPPAKPGALRLLAPQRGLITIGKEEEKLKPMDRTGIVLPSQARIYDRNTYSRKCQTLGVPRQSRGFT